MSFAPQLRLGATPGMCSGSALCAGVLRLHDNQPLQINISLASRSAGSLVSGRSMLWGDYPLYNEAPPPAMRHNAGRYAKIWGRRETQNASLRGSGRRFAVRPVKCRSDCQNRSGEAVPAWGETGGERVSTILPVGRPTVFANGS